MPEQKLASNTVQETSINYQGDISYLDLEQICQDITVKIFSGEEFIGSGIIIAKQNQTYIVITNDHVLRAGKQEYQIQTPDGKIYAATERLREASFDGKDLAVLKFVSNDNTYKTAKFAQSLTQGEEVFAAGFPYTHQEIAMNKPLQRGNNNTSNNAHLNKPNQEVLSGFIFNQGKVSLVLDKALEGGYQIGYTNEIYKGMSGGPLLNRWGELVAVNGMHAYPLWGDPYIYQDGSHPEPNIWEQMSHYSWGIPMNRIPEQLNVLLNNL